MLKLRLAPMTDEAFIAVTAIGSTSRGRHIPVRSLLLYRLLLTFAWIGYQSTKAQTVVIIVLVEQKAANDMSKVHVTIFPVHHGSPLSTTTDKDGNFKFSGLTPGAYRVYVQE